MDNESQTLNEEELKKKSCKYSIVEGSFSGSSSNFGDAYVIPFAQALSAQPWVIGLISAVPSLLSPFAQVYGGNVMGKVSRKTLVLKYVLLQSLLWLPIALLGVAAWRGFPFETLGILLAFGYSLLAVVGGITGPPWFSWMGDIVPIKTRGAYFSKRNRITGTFGMIAFFVSAFLLDFFKSHGLVFLGFTTLFSLAFLFRFVALFYFQKMYEPSFGIKDEDHFSFKQFMKRKGNFRNFSIFSAMLNISTMVAGPFFVVYMLQELSFSYMTFMIVSLSGTVFYLLLAPVAGSFSDKYGNLVLIKFASVLLIVYPLLWIVCRDPISLIFVTQLVGGIANAAFAIGTTNYIYDTVTPPKRGLCVAYMNILGGAGVFVGALAGGFLMSLFTNWDLAPFVWLFALSFVLRLVVGLIFLPRFKELRVSEKVPPTKELLLILGNKPMKLFEMTFIWTKNMSLNIYKRAGSFLGR